jgi:hypothetical protein
VQADDLEIPSNCFISCDLAATGPGGLLRLDGSSDRYDLVLSLEVVEHLPATVGPSFVATLCSLGDVVLFSAAMPHQGGVNHINETWPGYWSALFWEHGFECFDVLRSAFWLRPDVEWWYAQNSLIFAKGQSQFREKLAPVAEPMPYVHPRKYLLQVAQIRELAAALAEATTSPRLSPPDPAISAAEIEGLERKTVVLRALLEAKGGAAPGGLGSATLDALALYDRTRNQARALSTELAQLKGEAVELRGRVTALKAEVARAHDRSRALSAEVGQLREESIELRERGAVLEAELARACADADEARCAFQKWLARPRDVRRAPLRSVVETVKTLARRLGAE